MADIEKCGMKTADTCETFISEDINRDPNGFTWVEYIARTLPVSCTKNCGLTEKLSLKIGLGSSDRQYLIGLIRRELDSPESDLSERFGVLKVKECPQLKELSKTRGTNQ